MKYKVGDEVFVKGNFSGISKNRNCIIKTDEFEFFVEKDKVIPIPDMTAEEAWEIARKIVVSASEGGITIEDYENIFGKIGCDEIIATMTPQQAKEKIEAWEAEKEIKVGDEVAYKDNPNRDDFKFFVTKLDKKENRISGVSGFDGGVFWGRNITKYQKTGRHIDIDGLLKQIGGDE